MCDESAATVPRCFTSTIEHQNFDKALNQLLELVRLKSSTRIALVSGPTGAGKTTLRKRLEHELEAIAVPEIRENPEIIAYGGCSIKARGGSAFSWKDPYIQTLHSLQHPFAHSRAITQNQAHSEMPESILKSCSPDTVRRFTNDRLFRILQKTIEHRRPQAILFDEAHHFLRVGSSMTLVDQLEHIKFIADETRTLFILFGTYELTQLMDLSGALIRRREVVHLPRYVYEPKNKKDSLEPFAKVVAIFARDLAAHCEVPLLRNVSYLYQGSVGCIGILRDWLYRAHLRTKDAKGGRITMGILKETEFAASDRDRLLTEALNGEAYFEKRTLCEQEYLKRLGFSQPNDPSEATCDKEGRERKNRPYKRAPHNDPTGLSTIDPNKARAA